MKRFSVVSNGYDIDEVNRFIDIVIARMEKLNAENTASLAKIDKLNQRVAELSNRSNDNEKIEKAILAIQETGDKIREAAKDEARVIVDEAKNNANAIIHEALTNASEMEHTKMILEKNVKVYKDRVKSLLEAELEIIDDLDKIELSEVSDYDGK